MRHNKKPWKLLGSNQPACHGTKWWVNYLEHRLSPNLVWARHDAEKHWNPKKSSDMHRYTKEKFSLPCVLTNSTNAWLWLAPTLTLVFTTFPNGLQSSISSSSLHSHGKFRTCNTFDGGCVYRNCGCPAVEVISPRETTPRRQETQQTNANKHRQNTGNPQETH